MNLVARARILAACSIVAFVATRLVGCGGSVVQEVDDDASPGDASTVDSSFPGFDATPFPRQDGGFFYDAGTAPDGGPVPIVDCSDASADGGVECPSPPSVCLDDHWMRAYYGGTCGDAGVCEFTEYTMQCPVSMTPPDCYQGGCRIVIIR
jgi:hypothetical protein